MSDIANIDIDVDAHLWVWVSCGTVAGPGGYLLACVSSWLTFCSYWCACDGFILIYSCNVSDGGGGGGGGGTLSPAGPEQLVHVGIYIRNLTLMKLAAGEDPNLGL